MRDDRGNMWCDLCGAGCTHEYYDVYIPSSGCWRYTCPACFVRYHCNLGTGRGQWYVKGKKVAG